MVFKCQEDSFLKEFTSKVVVCEEAEIKSSNQRLRGYKVILEDTVLFPEGGGQPCDHGLLNDKQVIDVQRKGKDAIHYVVSEEPFNIGESVVGKVDWDRRHDHMQQHSGQHLITAIFEREFKYSTKSWSLGLESCYVELDATDVTQAEIDRVEQLCNKYIAEAVPVHVDVIKEDGKDNVAPEISRATRGLPKDHVGDIRVITIHGIDSNMCCGTHVTNLSQLQCIKLLNVEKAKNRLFLYFLIGNRVLTKLAQCWKRENELKLILSGGPSVQIDLARKLQASQKAGQRALLKCLKEIATFEGEKLKALAELPRWYSLHRSDGIESEFINTFLKSAPAISESDSTGLALLFLTTGDDTHKGQLVLQGRPEVIAALGPVICQTLDGKGNGKGARFQGKVNNLKRIPECEKAIEEYFKQRNQ